MCFICSLKIMGAPDPVITAVKNYGGGGGGGGGFLHLCSSPSDQICPHSQTEPLVVHQQQQIPNNAPLETGSLYALRGGHYIDPVDQPDPFLQNHTLFTVYSKSLQLKISDRMHRTHQRTWYVQYMATTFYPARACAARGKDWT